MGRSKLVIAVIVLVVGIISLYPQQANKVQQIAKNDSMTEEISTSTAFTLSDEELKKHIERANNGDAEAAFRLSNHYIGKEANKWLLKSAKMGSPSGQLNLGVEYVNKGDYTKAKYWLSKAASQGNETAQEELSHLEQFLD